MAFDKEMMRTYVTYVLCCIIISNLNTVWELKKSSQKIQFEIKIYPLLG